MLRMTNTQFITIIAAASKQPINCILVLYVSYDLIPKKFAANLTIKHLLRYVNIFCIYIYIFHILFIQHSLNLFALYTLL